MPNNIYAAPDPETVYTAALASAAAYDDKLSKFAATRLEQQGWKIRRFSRESKFIDAQFLLAERPGSDGVQTQQILAFCGTEKSIKDIITDLAAELIFFYPSPTRLVSVTYDNEQVNAGVLVHRGFQAYAATAMNIPETGGNLIEGLKSKQTSLIITGHSLGGAAATVFGAMLLECGVSAERMQVISFGAPPVGNLGFNNRYSALPLTRVVNPYDMVANLTGPVPDGAKRSPEYTDLLNYIHFGELLKNPVSIQDELRQHPIRVYIDYAVRARSTGLAEMEGRLASVKITNNAVFSGGHVPYMTQAVQEILSQMLAELEQAGLLPKADCMLEVTIDGRQQQTASDGWVSVSIVAKQRSNNGLIWAASRHVSLMEEMSPLAGAMMAADILSKQFADFQPYLDMPVPLRLPLSI